MESILNSIKQVLNINADDKTFDVDVIMHINAAFSTLSQLGVGPQDGLFVTSEAQTWSSFEVPENQLHMAKSYVFLKVKSLFDPPSTGFHTTAMDRQIEQFEWRLNMLREEALPDPEEVSP